MKKHKYLVTFHKRKRTTKRVCTRTFVSCVRFALKNMFKYGVFTIKKLK